MKRILLFMLLSSVASKAFAWGGQGHRVVGALAQKHLCPQALQTALELLDGHNLADASTWADDVRDEAQYAQFKPWHFVTMPLNSKYSVPGAHGDLVTALAAQAPRLKAASRADRAEALRLLIHFVGDAHQPLHAGEKEDVGGNAVAVNWFGQYSNLHHVWDTLIFETLGLSDDQLVQALDNAGGSVQQLTPIDWVNESSAIAATIYPAGSTNLSKAYYDQHISEVKERLRLAGMRLAGLLNEELGCSRQP